MVILNLRDVRIDCDCVMSGRAEKLVEEETGAEKKKPK
jgi:hypothetical protein